MKSPLHRHHCEVAFGDTDASGWMHFPNVFRYFEEAEHAFLKSRGLLVFDRALGGWPRVHVSCDYKRPLVTGDRIEVRLAVARVGRTSVTWEFEMVTADGGCAAAGGVTTVRVDAQGLPRPISDAERAALGGGAD
jgi:acyl-CoA thioester hydrolase